MATNKIRVCVCVYYISNFSNNSFGVNIEPQMSARSPKQSEATIISCNKVD